MNRLTGVAIAILFGALVSTTSAQVVTMESLLKEMVDLDHFAQLPSPAYSAVQFSSYDRRMKSPDDKPNWFSNQDFDNYLRVEDHDGRSECVLAEDKGPGAMVQLWLTGGKGVPDDVLRIYLDDSPKPVICQTMRELVDQQKLVAAPFVAAVPPTAEKQWLARNIYLPVPYSKSFKITRQGKAHVGDLFYYHAQLRRYAPGTIVETFSYDALARSRQTLNDVSAKLLVERERWPHENLRPTARELSPGEEMKWEFDQPGAIRVMAFQLMADDRREAFHSTVIEVAFDGQTTVRCPIGAFMGSGDGANDSADQFRFVKSDGTLFCQWVMPFQKNAVVKIRNMGVKQTVKVRGSVIASPWTWDERSMYFHAAWQRWPRLDAKALGAGNVLWDRINYGLVDLHFLEVQGRGRLMADGIGIMNYGSDWWGEGDEKIYLNGESFPSIIGTGTEDYYCYSWCRPQTFSHAWGGQPTGGGNKKAGYTVDNRVRLLDDIPFDSSMRFHMELLHSQPAAIDYSAATFFYARPGAKTTEQAERAGAFDEMVRQAPPWPEPKPK